MGDTQSDWSELGSIRGYCENDTTFLSRLLTERLDGEPLGAATNPWSGCDSRYDYWTS